MAASPIDRRTLPWLLATAAATVAPHLLVYPGWLVALVGLLMAWRAWLIWRGAPEPSRWLMFLLVLLVTGAIVAEYRNIFGQEPGVALLIAFMPLKLLELRRPRDGFVVVMLAYFLLLTHYFDDDGILVGAWMLAALTITTATLIQLQAPDGAIVPRLRLAGSMLLQSLPLMAVLFVLFPRIDGPLWGLPQDPGRATSGLSDTMSPGSISQLTQSPEIAFRVEFAGSLPDRSDLYWRGPVMTDYDGMTWTVARGLPGEHDTRITTDGPLTTYTMTLEPHQQRWLLALDMPVETPADTQLNASMALTRRLPVRDTLRYTARSAVDFRYGTREHPAILQRARLLPDGLNPRAIALARQWRANASDREVVERALAHFRSEPFTYTLNPPLLGRHAVDDFLFASRQGFCEHYAAAFAVLMRAAGIPARVVGGYQGGETNPIDGSFIVRQSDAHAWTEVWLPERGWQRIDPTAVIAPSRVEQGLASAVPANEALPGMVRGGSEWLRGLRYRWEALGFAWDIWVLGYNRDRQERLLSSLGLPGDWKSLATMLFGSCALVLAILAIVILRHRGRLDPAVALWTRFCRNLSHRGPRRHPWEGPVDYAERIAREHPAMSDVARRAAGAYARLRYGTPAPDDLDVLRDCVRRARKRTPQD